METWLPAVGKSPLDTKHIYSLEEEGNFAWMEEVEQFFKSRLTIAFKSKV